MNKFWGFCETVREKKRKARSKCWLSTIDSHKLHVWVDNTTQMTSCNYLSFDQLWFHFQLLLHHVTRLLVLFLNWFKPQTHNNLAFNSWITTVNPPCFCILGIFGAKWKLARHIESHMQFFLPAWLLVAWNCTKQWVADIVTQMQSMSQYWRQQCFQIMRYQGWMKTFFVLFLYLALYMISQKSTN